MPRIIAVVVAYYEAHESSKGHDFDVARYERTHQVGVRPGKRMV